jgi:hypothetical protein
MERLTTFAARMTPEDMESRAWLAISESLFALQRLSTIQAEQDRESGALEQAWLQRTAPAPKASPATAPHDASAEPAQPDDWREHILRSMQGEDRR